MNRILIVGAGIIGGSIIKKLSSNDDYQLGVYDINTRILLDIKNNYNCNTTSNYKGYNHIILSVPIKHVFTCLEQIKEQNPTANIYDCSSTKLEIENYALNLKLNYTGFHPMCGSEKNGFTYASADLFEGQTIISTKDNEFVNKLVKDLGANLKVMSSASHDQLTAQISHMPQLLSLLIDQVDIEARLIAGNGFKDMTRISNSHYEVWEDILKTNKLNLINELHKVNDNLMTMIDQYENDQFDQLKNWFKH